MQIPFRSVLVPVLLSAGTALGAVAGTGTATVTVNFVTEKLNVTATFVNQVYDLPGVNMGLGTPYAATNVALSDVDVQTGGSFEVPFENDTSSFTAIGNIACPAPSCAAIPGQFAFVGFLSDVPINIQPPRVFTFDGSVDCTGNVLGVNCSGPFAVNAFERAQVAIGDEAVITSSQEFFDPRLGRRRPLQTRVKLSNVTTNGVLDVVGFSRVRGAVPAPLQTSTPDGFEAVYFDIATGAIFTEAEVCVLVDADLNGVVDGTDTAVSRLAGLHYVGKAFVLENIRIDGPYGCMTVSSLSPFALVVNPPAATTTTTTLPGATTTTTTTATTTSTTTTLPPPCATARECLAEVRAAVECPEGLPASLGSFLDKKLRAVGTKLEQAASGKQATKRAKQAQALVRAVDKKAAALSRKKKKGISAACRASVEDALAPVLREIAAGRL